MRSETCKDREQQGFTQGNPDPSAASERFWPPRPWPLSSPHWPAHSRDVSPGMFWHRHSSTWDALTLFPPEANVSSGYQCAFLPPLQVQVSAQRLLFQGALPSTRLENVPCSLAFLSFLTWFCIFCFPKCHHSSLLGQRLCPTCWHL